MSKLINLLKKYPFVSAVFGIATLFFLIQHYFDFSWDFQAYLINAKYFFYGGDYLEVYRAPLISLILGPLLLFGNLAPYLYIVFVSGLFLYANVKLSGELYEKYFSKFRVKKEIVVFLFYLFSLNFFVLKFGLVVGTELLAIALFELFLYKFIKGDLSGHFLALAALSRYNFLVFFPMLFFSKDLKKIFKNIGLFFAVTAPWFIYNKIKWGNWFTSIADSFYLNIFSRLDRIQSFNIKNLLLLINWQIPLFLLGVALAVGLIFYYKKNKTKVDARFEILFFALFAIFMYDILSIPFKVVRYMFNLTLPVAFFSTLGAVFIFKNFNNKTKKILKYILLGIFILQIIILSFLSFRIEPQDFMYKEAGTVINNLGLSECRVLSPHWVPVNYYSGNVRFMPYSIDEALNHNEISLIFYRHPTMDDRFKSSEIDDYNQLIKTDYFVIIANEDISNESCIRPGGFDSPMTSSSCEALSEKFGSGFMKKIFLKTCNIINLDF